MKTISEDISSLSLALARVQRLTGTNKVTMARKIGYAIGLELASQRSKSEFQDIRSELSAVFRRLHLGKVILREWEPVVFVTCPDSKTESLESAFGQGVLEGVVHARSSEPVFVKHSIPRSTPREGTRFGYRKKNRSNWK